MLKSADRLTLLEALLHDCRKAFPNLNFQLRLDFAIINAQAFGLADKRTVAIYGGLGLNPKIGADALTFIALHEAGHHLAKGCRSKRDPSLACECASDRWAITSGKETLLAKTGRRLGLRVALEELDQIMGLGQSAKPRYTEKPSTCGCWAAGWSSRRHALVKRARPPTCEGHCITYVL